MLFEGQLSLKTTNSIAIIASRFNHIVTDRLIEGAKDSFLRHGGDESKLDLVLVPGAFELPIALEKLASKNKHDGILCLGAIIRGATPHFDYIAAEATKGIASVAIRAKMPITYGVLTTQTIEQAIERAGSKHGNKGFEAMNTLIEMVSLFDKI